eukprot:7115-Hanusia_phi.AAC.1
MLIREAVPELQKLVKGGSKKLEEEQVELSLSCFRETCGRRGILMAETPRGLKPGKPSLLPLLPFTLLLLALPLALLLALLLA